MNLIKLAISNSVSGFKQLSAIQKAGLFLPLVPFPILFPIFYARLSEFFIHARASPLRAISETALTLSSFGSLYAEAFGFKPLEVLWRHLSWKIHVPLRMILGGLSWYSLRRGVSPAHRTLNKLDGKLVLLTGATSGVGRSLADKLAIQGANLALLVRDAARGAKLADELRSLNPLIQVHVILVDLDNLRDVGKLDITKTNEIFSRGIDILVLNAGVIPPTPATFGPSGLEASITSMHFSHTLITKMCWHLLNKQARVVITSSIAHTGCSSVDTIFDSITIQEKDAPINATMAWSVRYSRAKFANALFARQLGRLADSDPRGIVVTAHHPGAVATNIWNGMSFHRIAMMMVNGIFAAVMRNNEEGAATLIDAAAGVEPLHNQENVPNGSYYISSSAWQGGFRFNALLRDADAGRMLWNRTDALISEYGPSTASWTYKNE
jgi:NAD(P)-dependent dehydrogenase (short-subunit alcohol dehydrogenase family)